MPRSPNITSSDTAVMEKPAAPPAAMAVEDRRGEAHGGQRAPSCCPCRGRRAVRRAASSRTIGTLQAVSSPASIVSMWALKTTCGPAPPPSMRPTMFGASSSALTVSVAEAWWLAEIRAHDLGDFGGSVQAGSRLDARPARRTKRSAPRARHRSHRRRCDQSELFRPWRSRPSDYPGLCDNLIRRAADDAAVKLGVGRAFGAQYQDRARADRARGAVARRRSAARQQQAGERRRRRIPRHDRTITVAMLRQEAHAIGGRRIIDRHEGICAGLRGYAKPAIDTSPHAKPGHDRIECAFRRRRSPRDGAAIETIGLVRLDDDEIRPRGAQSLPQIGADARRQSSDPALNEDVRGHRPLEDACDKASSTIRL